MARAARSAWRSGCTAPVPHPAPAAQVLPLADWVGLDIKAPLGEPAAYERVTGIAGAAGAVRASLRALLQAGVAHELRTTAHPCCSTTLCCCDWRVAWPGGR